MCFIQLTNYISEMCHTHGSTNPLVWSFVTSVKSRLTGVTMKIHVSWDLYTVSNGTWSPKFQRSILPPSLGSWKYPWRPESIPLLHSHCWYRITLSRRIKRPTWTLTSSIGDVVRRAVPSLPQMPSLRGDYINVEETVPLQMSLLDVLNPLNPELNPICYLLALLAQHFLHVSRIRVKSLTLRLLMSYIYGAPILDVSRSHTTTQHSR